MIRTAHRACVVLAALAILAQVPGCATPKGETRTDKRDYVQNMAAGSLAKLYKFEPGTRELVAGAPGYAVFDAVQTQLLITSTGNGYGLVHNNRTGKDYYMSAFGLGAGFGAGIKSQRVIIVFQNEQVMNKFVFDGWVFGASGTATAKAVDVEHEVTEDTIFEDGLRVYTFTDNGLMAGVSLRGGKVRLDEKLN
jgi:lipid-binding SYLF domain-containing protein